MAPGRRKREREETPPEISSPEPTDLDTAPGSPSPEAPPPTIKRRRGRPPKNSYTQRRPSTPATPVMDAEEPSSPVGAGSPVSTAASPLPEGGRGGWRGRGRGRGRGGGPGSARGKPRGGPSHTTTVPFDRLGNQQHVLDDEIVLEVDPAGETKVDRDGNLLGGRDYRCRTFTIKNRGDRLYMLSTEPARCIGFRDSYLFFQKHKQLFKIIVSDDEKFDMIARGLIPHSYKGRAIGVLTARSAFREFGARIVIGGRRVMDDYYEADARRRGEIAGELADPDDKLPPIGVAYNKNQYVAWHGASSVYHTAGSAVPEKETRSTGIFERLPKKKKVVMTEKNWMYEHAMSASNFNHILSLERRKAVRSGIYEPHTALTFYPSNLQPTSASWEFASKTLPRPEIVPTTANDDGSQPILTNGKNDDSASLFYPRSVNTVIDATFISPAESFNFTPGFSYEIAEDEDDNFLPWPGSGFGNGLKDVPADIYDDLEDDVKKLILEQVKKEKSWDQKWAGGETKNGLRGSLKV